jgi:hypothetical protein
MHLMRRHIASARPTASRANEALRPAVPTQLLATLLLIAKLCLKLKHRQHFGTRFTV